MSINYILTDHTPASAVAPEATEWHDVRFTWPILRMHDGRLAFFPGQVCRRWRDGRWEYCEREETLEEVMNSQW